MGKRGLGFKFTQGGGGWVIPPILTFNGIALTLKKCRFVFVELELKGLFLWSCVRQHRLAESHLPAGCHLGIAVMPR